MRIPSNQITINGHRVPNGWSAVDLQALVEEAVAISSGDKPEPWVTFISFNWTATLHGDAAVAFQESDDLEPGRDRSNPAKAKSMLFDQLEALVKQIAATFHPPAPPVFVIPQESVEELVKPFEEAAGSSFDVRAGLRACLKAMGFQEAAEIPPAKPADNSEAE